MQKFTRLCLICLLSAPVLPAFSAENLLKVNPDFENGSGGGYNGSGSITGWNYRNLGYKFFGVTQGGSSSSKAFILTDGGWLETSPADRPTVKPGLVYKLSFSARKTRDQFPQQFIGLRSEIRFYDAAGKFIHFYRPTESLNGPPADWEGVTTQCVAPAGAVTASAFVDNWQGQFFDAQRNYTNARDVKVDDFRLEVVPETVEKVRFRRAPRLIEPAKSARVVVVTGTNEARQVKLQLRKNTQLFPAVVRNIDAGRQRVEVDYPVPANAAKGNDYVWEATLLTAGGTPLTGAKNATSAPALLDETLLKPTVLANDPALAFQGRWKTTVPTKPSTTWPGSAVHLRFRGSTLRLQANVPNYIAPKDGLDLVVVIDGDETNWKKVRLTQGEQTVTLAENLSPTSHTASVVRIADVTRGPVSFNSFATDATGGFLRPEPISSRKIEFYGDSITEGGTTVPRIPNPSPQAGDRDYETNNFFSFANIATRALDANGRFICKGGMAISGNAFVPFTLPQMFDKLDFAGDVNAAETINFGAWQPDAIVIGIGHNDPFSKGYGEEKFAAAYTDFVATLRRVYPNAHIFCTDTTMTMDNMRQWEKAVIPLMKTDPKIHFNMFAQVDTGAHPHGPEHRNMAIGGGKQLNNLTDWISDTLGW